MASNAAIADVLTEWETLLAKAELNAEELAFLEAPRAGLVVELQGAKEARFRQGTHKAQVQQATRDLEGHLDRGAELATRLRNGIRSTYGLRGEKLTEFGMQPRRARSRQPSQEAKASKKAAADSTTTPNDK